MSGAVGELVEGATGPVKKLVKGKEKLTNRIGYGVGLLILFLLVIRFRSQIMGFIAKIPVLGPLLGKIAGA